METSQIKKKTFTVRLKRIIEPLLYLAPALVLLFLFTYFPFFKTVFSSFFRLDSQAQIGDFVGFNNFKTVLTNSTFRKSVLNSFIYAFTTVPISIAIALIAAILSNKKTKFSRLTEMLFSLNMAVSVSVAAMVFQLIFNPSLGFLNNFLGTSIRWLTDRKYSLTSIIIVGTWIEIGYNYLFLLSGVRGISTEVMERAEIDGTSRVRKLFKITIPLVSPTLFFLFTTQISKKIMEVALINILTQGGPSGSTETMISFMYKQSINNFNYSNGYAAATIAFIIAFVILIINFVIEKKGVHYQ